MYKLLKKIRDLEKTDPAFQNVRVKNLKQDIRQFQRDLHQLAKTTGEATWPHGMFQSYSNIYETAKRLGVILDDILLIP